jgi:ferredoxin
VGNEFVCVYRCMDCGRVATGDVKESEPEGWDYDDDACEFVCPEHASRLPAQT